MSIEVTINGQKEKIKDNTTVAWILKEKNIRPEMVAVEVNGELVERDKYSSVQLKQDDRMEFLFYMAGGSCKIPGTGIRYKIQVAGGKIQDARFIMNRES